MTKMVRGGPVKKRADVLADAQKLITEGGDYASQCQPVLRYLLHECFRFRPPSCEREFAERAFKFFDLCVDCNIPPTLPMLATALGYSATSSVRWVANFSNNAQVGNNPVFEDKVGCESSIQDKVGLIVDGEGKSGMSLLAQKCLTYCESVATVYAYDRSRCVGALFTLKASFGYVEAAPERITQSLPMVTINFLGGAIPQQIIAVQDNSTIPALNGIQPILPKVTIPNDNNDLD